MMGLFKSCIFKTDSWHDTMLMLTSWSITRISKHSIICTNPWKNLNIILSNLLLFRNQATSFSQKIYSILAFGNESLMSVLLCKVVCRNWAILFTWWTSVFELVLMFKKLNLYSCKRNCTFTAHFFVIFSYTCGTFCYDVNCCILILID